MSFLSTRKRARLIGLVVEVAVLGQLAPAQRPTQAVSRMLAMGLRFRFAETALLTQGRLYL